MLTVQMQTPTFLLISLLLLPYSSLNSQPSKVIITYPHQHSCSITEDCSKFIKPSKEGDNFVCTEGRQCTCLLGFQVELLKETDKVKTSTSGYDKTILKPYQCTRISCEQCPLVNTTCLDGVECKCLVGEVKGQGTLCDTSSWAQEQDEIESVKSLNAKLEEERKSKAKNSTYSTNVARKNLFTIASLVVMVVGCSIVFFICYLGFQDKAQKAEKLKMEKDKQEKSMVDKSKKVKVTSSNKKPKIADLKSNKKTRSKSQSLKMTSPSLLKTHESLQFIASFANPSFSAAALTTSFTSALEQDPVCSPEKASQDKDQDNLI